MNLLLCATAFLALLSPSHAPIQINVDAQNGDTLSGKRTFRVTVISDDPVNQVEFYVGSDLRDTETSTPYLFPWDTIAEKDGDVTVKFRAYTTQSQTSTRSLTFHVDNKLSMGADYHVKAAQDALTNSDWQHAIDEGRIALKIDPKNNGGRLVLSRAYLGLKTYDKAQQYSEDAITQDPKDDAALQLLAGIHLQQAFTTYAKEGGDRSDALTNIAEAFKGAVEARRKSLDIEADKMGEPTSQNLLPYVDALLRGERYSAAIQVLQGANNKDPKNLAVVDRLAYAQLRSGHYAEVAGLLQQTQPFAQLDAYSNAVLALAYIQLQRDADSDKAMEAAIESDPDNVGVRTAQAFIALKRNKTSVLASTATDLEREEGQRATVNYFLMALSDRLQRYSAARRYFETAALAEPGYPDIYIEQANYSIGLAQAKGLSASDRDEDYKEAQMYYQTALIARPEAVDALAGLAAVGLLQKNTADATKYAQAARDAAPGVAIGHYALSAAYEAAGRLGEADSEMHEAIKLDKANLDGMEIPNALDLWHYLNTAGRIPVIAAP